LEVAKVSVWVSELRPEAAPVLALDRHRRHYNLVVQPDTETKEQLPTTYAGHQLNNLLMSSLDRYSLQNPRCDD
jgi:hypothetical protein